MLPCADLPSPTLVYGSTASKPLFAQVAATLAQGTPPVTVLYGGAGSCAGVNALFLGTKDTVPPTYWDASGVENTCALDAAGQLPDIAVSDVYATTCLGISATPPDVVDFLGPIQTMGFVVPKSSRAAAISAEAAYFVYGFGAAGRVSPWLDDNLIFRRQMVASGTQLLLGTAIGVPATRWVGITEVSSDDLVNALTAASSADAAIGILSADVADQERDVLRLLAYRHFQQTCAYYPDSTAQAADKQNVRNGHYPLWGPLHLLSRVDSSGLPVQASAARVIDFLTGKGARALSALNAEIDAHTIPLCAMRVQRSTEMAALRPYASPAPCGCFFEAKNGGTRCAACSDAAPCGANERCSFGYCEAL